MMQPNEVGVDPARVTRRVYHSALGEWLMQPSSLTLGMLAALVGGVFYPVSLWLSLPFLLFWAPILLLEDWRMPMRMPITMDRFDPSTQSQVPGKLFGFLPLATMNLQMEKAAGILYLGYLRLRDAGRELWLSFDDLVRHILIFGGTGSGKSETLLGMVLNQLCFAKGLIYSDGKAQNDVSAAVISLSKRFGREDDVRVMNFINGGRSRAQELLDETNNRGQTNTVNAFGIAQESYIINLMDSMLPPAGSNPEWQEKARAMIQALVIGEVYRCRREGVVMSQRTILERLPLRKFAELYLQAVEQQWHEEVRQAIGNYLSNLAGFDLDKVASPSEWAPESFNQHGYLIQQFSRMLALFNDTYGHVFAQDAGDIDMRDVVHNDRILLVLIPALEVSSSEAATLGRLYVSQLAMTLSQDLGEKIEGRPEDIMVVKKYRDLFPFLWILDEVGAYYTEKIGEAATMVRSLGYCMVLAAQEAQRLKSAAGDKIWTLIANMTTRITLRIMDPKDTLEILQLMAGMEYRPEMSGLVHQDGLLGGQWSDGQTLHLREHKKVSVEEVQQLQKGEHITLFQGNVIRGASLYVADVDKFSKEPIQINRFIEVAPPGLTLLLAQAPAKIRRSYPRPDKVQEILRHLDVEPGPTDLENLVLVDPLLAGLIELDQEWQHIWRRRPTAAVRSTLLWQKALRRLPARGRGYQVHSTIPQPLAVGARRIETYKAQHVAQGLALQLEADGAPPAGGRRSGPATYW